MCLAVPGQIEDIRDNGPLNRTGRVSFGGAIREVNLAYVPEARVGDFVIVHVGFALTVLDADDARQTFAYLKELGEADPDGPAPSIESVLPQP